MPPLDRRTPADEDDDDHRRQLRGRIHDCSDDTSACRTHMLIICTQTLTPMERLCLSPGVSAPVVFGFWSSSSCEPLSCGFTGPEKGNRKRGAHKRLHLSHSKVTYKGRLSDFTDGSPFTVPLFRASDGWPCRCGAPSAIGEDGRGKRGARVAASVGEQNGVRALGQSNPWQDGWPQEVWLKHAMRCSRVATSIRSQPLTVSSTTSSSVGLCRCYLLVLAYA